MIRFILRVAFYALIILLIAAFFLNPTQDDFKKVVQEKLTSEFTEHLDNPNLELIVEEGTEFVSQLTDNLVKRDDYYICSVYTIELPTGEYRFLGAFKNFIPLQKENPLRDVFEK
ncbi:MAG: DUF4359 domain-containing protein [Flavobacteriales bacterium]|jgi:hypothetical protein